MEVFSTVAGRIVFFYMPCSSKRGQKRQLFWAIFGKIGPNGSRSDQMETNRVQSIL